MKARVVAVIPARLGSRRFSGKVLYLYRGKPLLVHVLDELNRARQIDRVAVATDSREVQRVLEGFGAEVLMTSARHRTGSDRVAEAAGKLGGDILINVQADNLAMKAAVLDRVIEQLKRDRHFRFATLARRLDMESELLDPNVVKVVISPDGRALWFSRLPIPYLQNAAGGQRVNRFGYYCHIGVYFFRGEALKSFARWPRSALEKAESLEQLRILEHGEHIRVFRTRMRSVSVDTPDDLRKIDGRMR